MQINFPEAVKEIGSFMFVDLSVMPATCSLDEAEKGERGHKEVAALISPTITKQRIDQNEKKALRRLRQSKIGKSVRDHFADIGAVRREGCLP